MTKTEDLYDHERSPKTQGERMAKRGDRQIHKGEEWESQGDGAEFGDKKPFPARLLKDKGQLWTPVPKANEEKPTS